MKTHPCPVCTSDRLTPFLQRSAVPVHQNLLVASYQAARLVTRGELDLVVCEDCGFVFNRAFDLSLLTYGEDYDNTQTCSAYFDTYLDGLVEHLCKSKAFAIARLSKSVVEKANFYASWSITPVPTTEALVLIPVI